MVFPGTVQRLRDQIKTWLAGNDVKTQRTSLMENRRLIEVVSTTASCAHACIVWDAWVPADATPARACVEARLADPSIKVEIAVIAAIS